MKKRYFLLSFLGFLLTACIGDDIIFDTVMEDLRFIAPIDTLAVGDNYTFQVLFTNNVGMEEAREITWSSSDETVVTIDDSGTASGISKGIATITAGVSLNDGSPLSITRNLVVDAETSSGGGGNQREGTIKTTSSYVLQGDFVVTKEGSDLIVSVFENYEASTALPGLYVYLSNNPSTTQGALEIGEVEVFQGAHSYRISGDVPLNQYDYLLYFCKPFNVKVGDGKME